MTTEIQKVLRIFGGQSSMARALGLSNNAISKWVSQGHVPPGRVLQIMSHIEGRTTPEGETVCLRALLEEACNVKRRLKNAHTSARNKDSDK